MFDIEKAKRKGIDAKSIEIMEKSMRTLAAVKAYKKENNTKYVCFDFKN